MKSFFKFVLSTVSTPLPVFIVRFPLLCTVTPAVQPLRRKVHPDCSAFLVAGSLPGTKLGRTTYRRMGTSFHATVLKSRIFDFSRTGLRSRRYGRVTRTEVEIRGVDRKSVCAVDKISEQIYVYEWRVMSDVIESNIEVRIRSDGR